MLFKNHLLKMVHQLLIEVVHNLKYHIIVRLLKIKKVPIKILILILIKIKKKKINQLIYKILQILILKKDPYI